MLHMRNVLRGKPSFVLAGIASVAISGCGAAYATRATGGAAQERDQLTVSAALPGARAESPSDVRRARGGLTEAPSPKAKGPQVDPPVASSKGPRANTDMLIYTARFTLSVFQVEASLAKVEALAVAAGGYLSLRDNTVITVRVPRERFDETVRNVEKIGTVLGRNIRAEDVTEEYTDLKTRLSSAKAMRERLEKLLGQASVKDALEIEKELHRIITEIERMEGKLNLLRDRVAFSTITVSFQPLAASSVRDHFELPIPWLRQLGLGTLLNLSR